MKSVQAKNTKSIDSNADLREDCDFRLKNDIQPKLSYI